MVEKEELMEMIKTRFYNLADNLPKEDNHNFNRNSIVGKIKNEVLIIEKLSGDVKTLNGCGCKMGEEVDGWEFEVETLKEFVEILKTYGSIHLNYFDDEEDLDIWLSVEK